MNGNSENNNEEINAVSLGSVDNGTQNLNVPIGDIADVTVGAATLTTGDKLVYSF